MAITKSAKKALRQNVTRRKRNLVYKNKTKSLSKKIRLLASQGKTEEANKFLSAAYRALDKAAKVGVIKKGEADRKKSRLTKLLKKA